MPPTVALAFALISAMLLGLIVMLTGAAHIVVSRRREAAVRAPLIATGIGVVVTMAAAITLGIDAALHLTHTYSTMYGSGN